VSGQVLIAVITTLVAVIGLTSSVLFSFLGRRDALHERQHSALSQSARQLVASTPAERAVGMALVVSHFPDPTVGSSAQRIVLNALHYDPDPLVFRIATDAIARSGLARPLLADLLQLNKQLLMDLLEKFNDTIGTAAAGITVPDTMLPGIQDQLAALNRNQRIVSELVKACSPDQLDWSGGYFPELAAPGVTFTEGNFSSALLHYANFRGAQFVGCNFDRAILIGAYLEGASFRDCSFADSVLIDVRIRHRPDGNPSGLPPDLLLSEESYSSFIYEVEHDWHGHWRGGPDASSFEARWWDSSGSGQVKASIGATRDGFERRESSDSNNGIYRLIRRELIDLNRGVLLVGGVRTLASWVPGGWRGIWWQHLGPGRLEPPAAAASQRAARAEGARRR
jgi:hypothetical protein